MLVNEKSLPRGRTPQNGALAGIWESFAPKEVADAELAGSGPGTPNASGSPTLGTMGAGLLVCLDANGQLVLMVSPDLSAAMPLMPWVVFSGDDHGSGAYVGDALVYHGGARLDTVKFVSSASYVPGAPLIASAAQPGFFEPKAAFGDHRQIVGFVGPRAVTAGVLDVLMPQGISGY